MKKVNDFLKIFLYFLNNKNKGIKNIMSSMYNNLIKISKSIIATDERRGNGASFEDYTGAVTYSFKG